MKRLCPTGYVLQENGLCGTGNTYATTGPTYCGPQYNGKGCKYLAQPTPGITAATGTESGPNMICAFQEGDAQFPCDPGCCLTEEKEKETAAESTDTSAAEEPLLPMWAIILLIIIGSILFICLVVLIALAAKKMSRRSSNGG